MKESLKVSEIVKKIKADFPKAKIGIVSNEEILKLEKKIESSKKKKQLLFF